MPSPSPLFSLIAIAVTAHVALVAARVTTSLYALSLQASAFTVGTLLALFALFPMLLAVPMGRVIDRIGVRKPLMGGCLLATAGVAVAASVKALAALYVAAILVGTGFMAIFIAVQHATGTLAAPDQRAASFSQLSVGFSTSAFIGPLLAGFTIDHASHATAFAACGVFTLLAFAMAASPVLRSLPQQHVDPHATKGSPLQLLQVPELRSLYAVVILLAGAWDLFTFVTPIRGTQLGFSASTVGMILASFSAATFVVRIAMAHIARRYHEWQVLTGALSAAALCYLLMPFMQAPWSMALVAAALGLALGSGQPNVLALLHGAAPAGRGAEAIAIRASIGNLSAVTLPLAFGAAGATLGLYAVFWGLGAAIACGIPIAARRAKKL